MKRSIQHLLAWSFVPLLILALACGGSPGYSPGSYPITATAGPGGSIAPYGTVDAATGSSATFTATPDAGYVVQGMTVDGTSIAGAATYTFNDIRAGHAISASFLATPRFTITVTAGPGGTITPQDTVVARGASQTFSIAANAGYQVVDVSVDGASKGPLAAWTFTDVQASHALAATFSPVPVYTIAINAGAGGTVTPGTTRVGSGGSQAFTIAPDSGYTVADVTIDGTDMGILTSYTFSQVKADHSLNATFAAIPGSYAISVSAGPGGSVTMPDKSSLAAGGATSWTAPAGSSPAFQFVPATGYVVDTVTVDGAAITGTLAAYTFSDVQAGHALAVTFRTNPDTFLITATVGGSGNGSIGNGTAAPGSIAVPPGLNQTLTFNPARYYVVGDVTVDGVDMGAIASYTFTDVLAPHSVTATFILESGTALLGDWGVSPSVGPLLDPATQTKAAANYNPLGANVTTLPGQRGIFWTGESYTETQVTSWATTNYTYWIDLGYLPGPRSPGSSFWPLYGMGMPVLSLNTPFGSFPDAALPHASAAGDITGTGKDSVVTVYYNGPSNPGLNQGVLELVAMNPDGSIDAPVALNNGTPLNYYLCDRYNGFNNTGQISVALCDLRGDGQLEVALLADSNFLLLDSRANNYQVLYACDYRNGAYQGDPDDLWWTCRLAAGDINNDGKDEVVVVRNVMGDGSVAPKAMYYVYGCPEGSATPAQLATAPVMDATGIALQVGNVAIGDLIGDGSRQVLFSGPQSVQMAYGMYPMIAFPAVIMGTWNAFSDGTGMGTLVMPGGGRTLSQPGALPVTSNVWQVQATTCFRAKAGLPQYLFGLAGVFTYGVDGPYLEGPWYVLPSTPNVTDPANGTYPIPDYAVPGLQLFAAGDVDNSGADGLVSLYIYNPAVFSSFKSAGMIFVFKPGPVAPGAAMGQVLNPQYYVGLDEKQAPVSSGASVETVQRSLCLPDWYGRCPRLQFTGRSPVGFSRPTVVAALSAPPYDTGQNSGAYSSCSTSFGDAWGTYSAAASALGVGAAWVPGGPYWDALAPAAQANLKTRLMGTMGRSGVLSQVATANQVLTTPANQDSVAYACVPFDPFNYSLVGAATPTRLVLYMPRPALLYTTTPQAFNAMPGNPTTFPAALFRHTIGKSSSYPAQATLQGYLGTSYIMGPGFNGNLELLGITTASCSVTENVTAHAGPGFANLAIHQPGGLGWATLDGSPPAAYDLDLTLSTPVNATLEGTTPTTSSGPLFDFGLAAYSQQVTSGLGPLGTVSNPFILLNYWTSNGF